ICGSPRVNVNGREAMFWDRALCPVCNDEALSLVIDISAAVQQGDNEISITLEGEYVEYFEKAFSIYTSK
ncbi:MAG: hypothetical protein IJC98_08815, partial [Clostridia bacterium]|nr:hypothetical protein [Clostridia bacterium]